MAALLPVTAMGQPAAAAPSSRFLIFLRSAQIGTEESTVVQTADGWTIAGSGRIGPPLDITVRRLEVKYDAQWRPQSLALDATARDQVTTLQTTVTGDSARSNFTTNGTPGEKTDTIAADAILLPNPFFSPYEALAARLKSAAAGATLQLYTVPQGLVTATVGEAAPERIQTTTRLIDVRRTKLRLQPPAGPQLDIEIWGDESGRLLRVSVPAQTLDVVRDDIAAVSARRVTITRAGDQQVRIPANGFSLAGTLSKPMGATTPKLPAVILVGGSGPTDRDENAFGIPIFGQLAHTLADAGFLVLRYDKRGVGQSGGRPESATLADYAEDLRGAVKFMADRKDVDQKRLAVLGHSEGGSVAMLAASRDARIKAIVLVATMGVTGAELNLAQVSHALSRSTRSEEEKQTTLDLQKRIQTAVVSGQGWDTIPPALRKQADVPWFSSYLAFDPAKPMSDIRQPMLIIQGELDTQVAPLNADRLAELAKARKRQSPVAVVKVPGMNHLLVPATTGEVDEYGTLVDKTVSPALSSAIAEWLTKTFQAVK